MKFLIILALPAVLLAGCAKGEDRAECGGINNTGTITGPITANCAQGGQSGGSAGTDRHDVQNPAPVVVVPPGSTTP